LDSSWKGANFPFWVEPSRELQQEHDLTIVSKERGLCAKQEQKKTTANTGRAPPSGKNKGIQVRGLKEMTSDVPFLCEQLLFLHSSLASWSEGKSKWYLVEMISEIVWKDLKKLEKRFSLFYCRKYPIFDEKLVFHQSNGDFQLKQILNVGRVVFLLQLFQNHSIKSLRKSNVSVFFEKGRSISSTNLKLIPN